MRLCLQCFCGTDSAAFGYINTLYVKMYRIAIDVEMALKSTRQSWPVQDSRMQREAEIAV